LKEEKGKGTGALYGCAIQAGTKILLNIPTLKKTYNFSIRNKKTAVKRQSTSLPNFQRCCCCVVVAVVLLLLLLFFLLLLLFFCCCAVVVIVLFVLPLFVLLLLFLLLFLLFVALFVVVIAFCSLLSTKSYLSLLVP